MTDSHILQAIFLFCNCGSLSLISISPVHLLLWPYEWKKKGCYRETNRPPMHTRAKTLNLPPVRLLLSRYRLCPCCSAKRFLWWSQCHISLLPSNPMKRLCYDIVNSLFLPQFVVVTDISILKTTRKKKEIMSIERDHMSVTAILWRIYSITIDWLVVVVALLSSVWCFNLFFIFEQLQSLL